MSSKLTDEDFHTYTNLVMKSIDQKKNSSSEAANYEIQSKSWIGKKKVEQLRFGFMGKKRGPRIRFHDEYHRIQRELMRKYRAEKRRKLKKR